MSIIQILFFKLKFVYMQNFALNDPYGFYEALILLEEVDDSEILGCTISTIHRTITVRQQKDLVSLRSGLSEDSDIAVVSAFRARALLII